MAFGINPHFTIDLAFDGLNSEQILALTVDTARQMGWIKDTGLVNWNTSYDYFYRRIAADSSSQSSDSADYYDKSIREVLQSMDDNK
jgi:hypothetical protein